MEPVKAAQYYEAHAIEFAEQVIDTARNRFEYKQNMPAILEMTSRFGGSVLDFGCGAGNFTAMLVREDRCIYGCDTSKTLLSYAKQVVPSGQFFRCTEDGEIKEVHAYNLIIAKLVFHYIENLGLVLNNLHKVLKPSGAVIFSVPHPLKTEKNVKQNVKEAVYQDEVGKFGLVLDMIHRSEERYENILNEAHFSIVRTETVWHEDKPMRLNVLARKTG